MASVVMGSTSASSALRRRTVRGMEKAVLTGVLLTKMA